MNIDKTKKISASVFSRGNSEKQRCVVNEVNPLEIKFDEVFLKDISEIAVFSNLNSERDIVSYFLYSKNSQKFKTENEELPQIIFLSSEDVIFGCPKKNFDFVQNSEYSLELVFPLKIAGPIKNRKMILSFVVERVFNDEEKSCVVCKVTTLKAEDARFLDERW